MITVQVIRRRGRKFFQAEWRDPVTGRIKSKSTRCTTRKAALKFAGALAADLNAGRHNERRSVTWATFRDRWETEVGAGLAAKTTALTLTVFKHVETIVSPRMLDALDASEISEMVKLWRKSADDAGYGLTEPSIKAYLTHLRAALNWAHGIKLIREVPMFTMPKRTQVSRGRAVTTEEFERMLKATPKVVGEERAPSWQDHIEGLFWSGLRLGESLELHWTDDRLMSVDFSGRRPMLVIRPDGEKSHEDRLLPITPEFANWLKGRETTGYVFNPAPPPGYAGRPPLDMASKTIASIGREAGVKVKTLRDGSPRFASAHDLRRSFGTRWSKRVGPQVLQRLMRHASIQTTMKFYVDADAHDLADDVWQSSPQPDTRTDTEEFSARHQRSETHENHCN